jgi:hypothetical protein
MKLYLLIFLASAGNNLIYIYIYIYIYMHKHACRHVCVCVMKRRLNSGNACYHSMQNILYFPLLLKNLKIRMTCVSRQAYEECRLLGYTPPVRPSLATHHISATESNMLMLCKIWGFHGSDYEECCLLGYKNPVRTSQETHYFSATESSQLMLCKIWGFHGVNYEECRLLGCHAMWLL